MQLIFQAKNVELPEALRAYAQKKLERLERYLNRLGEIRAEFSIQAIKNGDQRCVVQATTSLDGMIIRAEEGGSDFPAAIDAVAGVMRQRLVRHKERLIQRKRGEGRRAVTIEVTAQPEEVFGRILRTKRLSLEPMEPEEAAERMEALGHDFFLFLNPATRQVNVVYRRRDGSYGLIEPS
ncbi:MAG: ribosome-associated translation inhibitor RaiA [Chloroflexi bacterium]|nr:ribosome-associated translation inhibitor RaiA [Chloroflexota bacterium]